MNTKHKNECELEFKGRQKIIYEIVNNLEDSLEKKYKHNYAARLGYMTALLTISIRESSIDERIFKEIIGILEYHIKGVNESTLIV